MKALIFGAGGQDGYYLAQVCQKKQIEPICVSRNKCSSCDIGDVSSREDVDHLIETHHPEFIFHLAAISTTQHQSIYENHNAIGTGTLNILETVKQKSPKSKVFITGSGVQFVNKGKPISETDPFDHGSLYTASRNYSVFLARYFRTLGIKTYVGYLFHHESPLRTERHISQKIVKAVKRIADGSNELIELGDISVKKEWSFARDITEGIMTLIRQDRIFESVIGSGIGYSIENWLEACFSLIGKNWKDYVTLKKNFHPEYQTLISDPKTINSLGWAADTSINNLAKIMLNQNN